MLSSVLSILGLVLTVIGFGITIYNAWKARSAAEAARTAVDEVRTDISRIDMVAAFSSAIASMDEIKRLHRQRSWPVLPDRYSELRKSLVEMKSANPELLERQKTDLQNSIVNLRGIESQIDEALNSGKDPSNITRLINSISEQTDSLQTLLTEIKAQIGT